MVKRKVVQAGMGIAREIAEDAVGAIAKKADDWGWKGGKPGELTGGVYQDLSEQLRRGNNLSYVEPNSSKWVADWQSKNRGVRFSEDELVDEARKQLSRSGLIPEGRGADPEPLMLFFSGLEDAGVPRRLTGKIAKSMDPGIWDDVYASTWNQGSEIGKAIQGLNDTQVETFLNLLPTWQGSLDVLADTARILGG